MKYSKFDQRGPKTPSAPNFASLVMTLVAFLTTFGIFSYIYVFSQVPDGDTNFLRSQVEELRHVIEQQQTIVREHVHKRTSGTQISHDSNYVDNSPKIKPEVVLKEPDTHKSPENEKTVPKITISSRKDVLASIAGGLNSAPPAKLQPDSGEGSNQRASAHDPDAVNRLLGLETVLLIVCSDRPDYLKTTLDLVVKHHPKKSVPIVVSEDGTSDRVGEVIRSAQALFRSQGSSVSFVHLHHPQGSPQDMQNGYFRLAYHFKWALTEVFSGNALRSQGQGGQLSAGAGAGAGAGVKRVIILEEDLKIAPDFFEFFAAVANQVDTDETLLGKYATTHYTLYSCLLLFDLIFAGLVILVDRSRPYLE
jgi:GNT-I family